MLIVVNIDLDRNSDLQRRVSTQKVARKLNPDAQYVFKWCLELFYLFKHLRSSVWQLPTVQH